MLCMSYRKVGGLRFIKVGRLTFMWCVSKRYRPLKRGSRALQHAVASVMNEVDNPLLSLAGSAAHSAE